jgi:GDP-L-fucose synthase
MDGKAGKDEILQLLSKYGITLKQPDNDDNSVPQPVSVEIWGTGKPMREFLWSEEMAEACVFVVENVDFKDVVPTGSTTDHKQHEVRNTHINIGTGKEVSIRQLAELVKEKAGYNGKLYFNTSKPDGTMKKLTDPSKIHNLGWHHKIEIEEGVENLYRWYTEN